MQVIFSFLSFKISEDILRNQNCGKTVSVMELLEQPSYVFIFLVKFGLGD